MVWYNNITMFWNLDQKVAIQDGGSTGIYWTGWIECIQCILYTYVWTTQWPLVIDQCLWVKTYDSNKVQLLWRCFQINDQVYFKKIYCKSLRNKNTFSIIAHNRSYYTHWVHFSVFQTLNIILQINKQQSVCPLLRAGWHTILHVVECQLQRWPFSV